MCIRDSVYQRALFPLMPGRFAIPPAQLVYSLPLSASFFSREETHELQTDSTVIVAVEPPASGRPSDFGGAVGSLRVAAKLDTSVSRVGDPMLLTVRVSGTGNVKLFPRPAVGVSWASLVKGDERVQVDTTARRIAGSKEFDWALRPRYRGAPRAPVHEHPVFWALLALAPIPALTLKRGERRKRGPSSERAAKAIPIMALLRGAGRRALSARVGRSGFLVGGRIPRGRGSPRGQAVQDDRRRGAAPRLRIRTHDPVSYTHL